MISLVNNITWGRSVHVSPEMFGAQDAAAPSDPIVEASQSLETAEAAAHKEAAIAVMRQEEDRAKVAESLAALTALPLTIRVVPFPGFVIKTRRVIMDDNKVFINVFHHTSLPDEHKLLTFVPYMPKAAPSSASPVSVTNDTSSPTEPSSNTTGNTLHVNGNGTSAGLPTTGEPMTPILYFGAPSTTEDKEGYVSLLYNVLVSSAYFERATVRGEEVHITHPTSVNKVRYVKKVKLLKCFQTPIKIYRNGKI